MNEEDLFEENQEPEPKPVDIFMAEQNAATASAFVAMDADPEEAARAYDLARTTGANPNLIYPNVKEADHQNRAAMTAGLVRNNQYLQRFLIDPVQAAISNDDLGQLDIVSERLIEFSKTTSLPKEMARAAGSNLFPMAASLAPMAAGAKVGGAAGLAVAPFLGPAAPAAPLVGGFIGAGIGGITASYAASGIQDWVLSKLPASFVEAIGMSPESRAMGAKLYPTATFIAGMAPFALTMKPWGAPVLERVAGAGGDAAFEIGQQLYEGKDVNWKHVALASAFGATFATPNRLGQPAFDAGNRVADAFIARVRPFIEAGKEPPAGIDPIVDAVKTAETELGIHSLEQALEAAAISTTRERNPDVFAAYLRLHTEANIGISPEGFLAVYGDGIPTPDDGILGWVPDIQSQLLTAIETGTDVRVPVADWLAKVDPAVATGLRDFIRVNPDGITLAESRFREEIVSERTRISYEPAVLIEGKIYRGAAHVDALDRAALDLGIPYEELIDKYGGELSVFTNLDGFVNSDGDFVSRMDAYRAVESEDLAPILPTDLIRDVAGLRPVGIAAPRRMVMELLPEKQLMEATQGLSEFPVSDGTQRYDFAIRDLEGNVIGYAIGSSKDGGKSLYIEDTASMTGEPFSFGTSAVYDLLVQLKTMLPQLEEIGGFRVSGARDKAGATISHGRTKIKIPPSIAELAAFQRRLADSKPYDKFFPMDKRIESPKSVGIPEVQVQPLRTFKSADMLDIADRRQLEGLGKVLAEFFRGTLKKRAGDVPFHVISDADMAKIDHAVAGPGFQADARYLPEEHAIIVAEGALNRGAAHLDNLIYEEIAHAVTVRALSFNSTLKKDVRFLMDETVNELQGHPLLRDFDYYFSNEFEFLAAAMTFPAFQEQLAMIPVSRQLAGRLALGGDKPTVWQAIRKIVADLLEKLVGIRPKKTVLDGIFKTLERIDEFNPSISEYMKELGYAAPTKLEDRIITASREVMEGSGRVYLRDLRAKLSDVSKEALDAELKRLQSTERLALYRIDNHSELTPEISEAALRIGNEPREILVLTGPGGVMETPTTGASESSLGSTSAIDPTNVLRLARGLKTDTFRGGRLSGSFEGRVAIAQVYDAYKEENPNIGSLEEFKRQILEAARSGKIILSRLDLPERMNADLRRRSETKRLGDFEHFIVTRPSAYAKAVAEEPKSVDGIQEPIQAKLPKATSEEIIPEDVEEVVPPQQPVQASQPFENAATFGFTQDEFRRYLAKVDQQQRAEVEAAMARAEAEIRRRESKQWKEWEAEERPGAVEAINSRPDIRADGFIRNGELFGEKLSGPHRLRADLIPEDIRSQLSSTYFSKDGVSPDDIAPMFGYPSGDAMLAHLIEFDAAVKAANIRPADYKRMLIAQETTRRVEEKHGKLEENILAEATDQVLSETQFEILHEETLRSATAAGLQFTLTKEDILRAAKEHFDGVSVEAASSDQFLAAAGRASRDIERALLRGDFQEAFRLRQRKYFATVYAKLARELEKEKAKFEKTTTRFRQRQVPGVDQTFTNQIHRLMMDFGISVRRSVQDIADTITADGTGSLIEFVAARNADGWEINLATDLLVERQGMQNYTGPDSLTVAQFRELRDSLESLAFVGREVNKIEIAGQKEDFANFRRTLVGNISQLPVRNPKKAKRFLWSWDAMLTRVEEMARDLDLRQELGPMWRSVIEPMMDAKHTEFNLQEKLEKRFKEMASGRKEWQRTLDQTIPQDFFFDPYYGSDPRKPFNGSNVPFDLTRSNLIWIMANFGNRSNISKFVRGYAGRKQAAKFERQLRALIDQHATKEDWDFVQDIWDTFEEWRPLVANVYQNLSGLAPVWVEAQPVDTPFGQYRGGYFPIIYDRLRSDINLVKDKAGKDPEGLFKKDYFRATTGNGYTVERTGVAKPIEFSTTIDELPARMQQQIHDIAYRPAIVQVAKVLYDKEIQAAIKKHYGVEYQEQLIPWLKDLANNFNKDDVTQGTAYNLLRRARMNLAINALGLNLRVLLSPAIGRLQPFDKQLWQGVLANPSEATRLAWEKSKEIPHTFRTLDRDYRERLEKLMVTNRFDNFQRTVARAGFYPIAKVEQFFRIGTFVTEYQKGLAKGLSESDAATAADIAVRERHSVMGPTELPAIMRGGEVMKTFTMFYGYFSTMYNWQRQLPGAARQGDAAKMLGIVYGTLLIPALFNAALFTRRDEDEPLWKFWARATALVPLQTVPFLREFASQTLEGFRPRTPLASAYDAILKGGGSIEKAIKGQTVKKPVQTAANTAGILFGLPLGQVGRTGQFLKDVNERKQRPRNIWDWINGIIHGEVKPKR